MKSIEIIRGHDAYRSSVLNLQASENYLSEEVRSALASDMASRYSMVFDTTVHGAMVHNAYGGARFQEEITEYAESLASEIFGFEHVNVKPISGHIAAMSVLVSLAKRGDRIMAISPEDGGYDGYSQDYLANMLGLEYRPLRIEGMRNVIVEDIMDFRPNLVILGASYILFPYNLREVIEVSRDIGAKVVYDASHVLGLLPGGFQEGIEECEVVYGSTHKSYPGPQGGIIMSNHADIARKILEEMTWRTQDNYHTNRVAALAVSLEEFGPVAREYGQRVRRNSKALASRLHELGIKVRLPPDFTESHQILLDDDALREEHGLDVVEFGEILERNRIIVDRVGRLGTAELTWKGYGEEDMIAIAHSIHLAVLGEDVSQIVHDLIAKWDGKTLGKA